MNPSLFWYTKLPKPQLECTQFHAINNATLLMLYTPVKWRDIKKKEKKDGGCFKFTTKNISQKLRKLFQSQSHEIDMELHSLWRLRDCKAMLLKLITQNRKTNMIRKELLSQQYLHVLDQQKSIGIKKKKKGEFWYGGKIFDKKKKKK